MHHLHHLTRLPHVGLGQLVHAQLVLSVTHGTNRVSLELGVSR